MKHIFSNKTLFGLWLAIFFFSLLGGGQNVLAQWGLVDTVWVGPWGGEGNMYPSDNDSLFISGYAVRKTIDNSIFYLCKEWEEMYPKFMNDSTIMFTTGDSIGVISLKTKQRVKMLNCKGFSFYHNLNPYNYNPYSKYDNCVYETNENNSRKLNLETGEVTEVPYLKGLDGSSISQDGEMLAGFYFKGQWLDGKKVYDLYFRVISLNTGEIIIPDKLLLKELDSPTDHNPEFIFSRDHLYLNVYSFGSSHIWDLSTKTKIKEIQRKSLGSGKSINFTKVIFTNDSKRIFTLMSSMRNPSDSIMLDSTGYIIYDLSTLKEYRYIYPYGISFGGTPQAFVFSDKNLLTDGAVSFNGDYIRLHQNSLGNSSLLKLNFDINSVQGPEQKYEGVIYPNPATDYITVSFVNPPVNRWVDAIEIYNIFGERVLVAQTPSSEQRIDVSNLPPGLYFLKIGNEKPNKFIKL